MVQCSAGITFCYGNFLFSRNKASGVINGIIRVFPKLILKNLENLWKIFLQKGVFELSTSWVKNQHVSQHQEDTCERQDL